mgnify:FL=1
MVACLTHLAASEAMTEGRKFRLSGECLCSTMLLPGPKILFRPKKDGVTAEASSAVRFFEY